MSEPRTTLNAEMLGHGADGERASLVRDTPLARVLPWRILEFRHG